MKVAQWVWLLATPWTIQSMEFSRPEYWRWLLPSPGDQAQVSYIVSRFFIRWATREAKNTGVGSLSLLQHIFPTQESNWGLLHSIRILYQLSFQGSQKHQWVVLVLVAQSCPLLCDPMDCSPPGSCVHGILQARMLEWVAIPSSRGSSWPRDQTWLSCIADRSFTIWALTIRDPGNLGFYYQELNHIINSLPTHLFLPRIKISWRWNWEWGLPKASLYPQEWQDRWAAFKTNKQTSPPKVCENHLK